MKETKNKRKEGRKNERKKEGRKNGSTIQRRSHNGNTVVI